MIKAFIELQNQIATASPQAEVVILQKQLPMLSLPEDQIIYDMKQIRLRQLTAALPPVKTVKAADMPQHYRKLLETDDVSMLPEIQRDVLAKGICQQVLFVHIPKTTTFECWGSRLAFNLE